MRHLFLPHTALLLSLALMGCTDSVSSTPDTASEVAHDHDHGHDHGHDHPTTLEDGVAALSKLRDTVRDAFAADDVDTAHGPLHDVGHLLETIDKLAAASELSDEQKATAKKSVETLFEQFGAVDKTLHGQDGSTYSEASAKIDAAIAALEELTKPADTTPEATDPPASDDSEAPQE